MFTYLRVLIVQLEYFCDCFIRVYIDLFVHVAQIIDNNTLTKGIIIYVQIDWLGGSYGLITPIEHSFQNKHQDIRVVYSYRLFSRTFY